MTVEERAYKYTASCGAGDIWDQVITAMEAALRDQIEECANVAGRIMRDHSVLAEHSWMADKVEKGIRALAAPTEEKSNDDGAEDRFTPGGFWYQ